MGGGVEGGKENVEGSRERGELVMGHGSREGTEGEGGKRRGSWIKGQIA